MLAEWRVLNECVECCCRTVEVSTAAEYGVTELGESWSCVCAAVRWLLQRNSRNCAQGHMYKNAHSRMFIMAKNKTK